MAIYGGFSLPAAIAENTPVYKLTRTAFEQTDAALLATVTDPKDGAIAIISTVIDEKTYGQVSFMYSEELPDWVALVGNVDADHVILRNDITLAGNYTQVGNLTKSQTGTGTFATNGKSVADALTEMLSKREQPKITANPSAGNLVIAPTGTVEAGTKYTSISGGKVSFEDGAYTYEATTGVKVTGRTAARVSTPASTAAITVADDGSFTDTFACQIGDKGGDGVYSSIKYTETVNYSAGNIAKDNLGAASSPAIQIKAGSVTKTSGELKPFRKYFYAATTTVKDTFDSAAIRAMTGSSAAATAGTKFDIAIPAGCKQVVIAYPATVRDINLVADKGAFGTDIKGSFVKQSVDVEGANGYTAIEYKVYVYTPAAALGANTYNVTI